MAQDEKLSKFYLAINHFANEERKKIEDEMEAYRKEQLDLTETELLTEAYELIQKEMGQMRGAIAKEISQREQTLRSGLLSRRTAITQEVFQEAAARLEEFTRTKDYPAMLARFAENLAPALGEGAVLRLRERDRIYEKELAEAYGAGCTFATDPAIRIGGLAGESAARGLFADETLDAMLEAQREWFEEHSGLTVV